MCLAPRAQSGSADGLTQFQAAIVVLLEFVRRGDITPDSDIFDGNGKVSISYIEVPAQRRLTGVARRFLVALKAAGVSVDISHPKAESFPFWAKMHKDGLIPHSPYQYTTWEDA